MGWRVLRGTSVSLGPFLAPIEHYRFDGGAFLPWFVTGSGAFVYALNAMFVQVFDEEGARLLPAVPESMRHARFQGLAADRGVRVSGQLADGRVKELVASASKPVYWRFQIPRRWLDGAAPSRGLRLSTSRTGWFKGEVHLKTGDTPLLRRS